MSHMQSQIPEVVRKRAGLRSMFKVMILPIIHAMITFATWGKTISWFEIVQLITLAIGLLLLAAAFYRGYHLGPWSYTVSGVTVKCLCPLVYLDQNQFQGLFQAFSERWIEAPGTRSDPMRDLEGYEITISLNKTISASRSKHNLETKQIFLEQPSPRMGETQSLLNPYLLGYELGYASMYQEFLRGSQGVCGPSRDGSHEFYWLQWRKSRHIV